MTTERQKIAMQHIVENGGPISEAMRKAGYSENTIKSPSKLTTSEGWKELVVEVGKDIDLSDVMKEGLNADKPLGEGMTFPDYPTRHKYMDTLIKIGGGYAAEKIEISTPEPLLGGQSNNGNTSNNSD